MDSYFQDIVNSHCNSITQFFEENQDNIYSIVEHCFDSLVSGGKIISFGNGGSASDASHFTGELVGRFEKERKGIAAISLTADSVNLTAIGNDYGYENIFSRQIDALAKDNDVLLGISTSGTSKNVIEAFRKSRSLNIKTLNILLTSQRLSDIDKQNLLKHDVDYILSVPSKQTCRIQEVHIMFLHCLADLVEKKFS